MFLPTDEAARKSYIELLKAMQEEGTPECAQLPDVFFPNEYEFGSRTDIRLAKAVCARCPIRMQCLEYALIAREPHGIWAGLLPRERADLKRLARTTSSRLPEPSAQHPA